MLIKSAPLMPTEVGVAGHNGVGHAVSHSGFLQDDSMGFATIVNILLQACPLDLSVSSITFEGHSISIELGGGGIGTATAARVFTRYEKILVKRAIGQVCLTPCELTYQVFGRGYGNGISDTVLTFELALSRAIVDTIREGWGETLHAYDDVPESCGEFLGGVVYIDELPVSWLLTINSSLFGNGPNEDSEGIIPIGNKGKLMAELGMNKIPLIILESKAYAPAFADRVKYTQSIVRWNEEFDNPIVGKSIIEALEKLKLPYMADDSAYKRDQSLEIETVRVGKCIADLGNEYAQAKTSARKVNIAATLSKLLKQDVGGSIFMSTKLFEIVAGGGLWPGQAAVLSIIVSKEEINEDGVIIAEAIDLQNSTSIVCHALNNLYTYREEAQKIVDSRAPNIKPDELLRLACEI